MVSLRTKRTYHRGYLYWHNWWWLNVQSSQREPYASVAMRRSLVSEKDANPKLMGRGSLCGKVFSLACTCYGLRRRNLDNCITRERIRQVSSIEVQTMIHFLIFQGVAIEMCHGKEDNRTIEVAQTIIQFSRMQGVVIETCFQFSYHYHWLFDYYYYCYCY